MNDRVTIIAEAAQGYEGNRLLACLLVRAAAAAGADAVKFQVVYADELAARDYAYHGLFKSLEMDASDWEAVAAEARIRNIGLVFDVFGLDSLKVAQAVGVRGVKVHASDFFNQRLVDAAVADVPEVYFSAGGIEADEIETWLARFDAAALARLTMLYGFQAEPTGIADNHLARLGALRRRFPQLRLGFMDHTAGDSDEAGWLGVLALPFGISAIEKHITLDRSLQLEDHVSALTALELATYIGRVRTAEAALGSADLGLSAPERGYREKALKAVVTARALEPGATVQSDDVVLLRAPIAEHRRVLRRLDEVVGRPLQRAVAAGRALYADDLA